jgi:hypothetical protein
MARPSSLAVVSILLLGTACVVPSPERQLLQNFFAACQVYDTTAMARLGTAACNPRADGVVEQFEVLSRTGDEVVIAARVRPLGGSAASQSLRVRLARQDGRLVVAGITRLPASQTLPATSSAPLN